MSDISVLGLGLMGGTLARTLRAANHAVTVWNRSPDKMEPLVAAGASAANSAEEAIAASDVSLVCVTDYDVARSILGTEEVVSVLSGRTVVHVSTGTPQEARDMAALCQDAGATYLDGAILVLPVGVGGRDAQILFAGPRAAFDRVAPMLECLAGDLEYLGGNVGAAATLDLAWLCQRCGMILGAIHGSRLCESEGVGLDVYSAMFPEGDRVKILADAIRAGAFDDPEVTNRIWAMIVGNFQKQARSAGINSEFPDFAAGLIDKAVDQGYADQDIAALVKVLRG
jgi:3-hydroxyisobutyrate dehydrogenase-like beta-hydroxyacid dehydrogenase